MNKQLQKLINYWPVYLALYILFAIGGQHLLPFLWTDGIRGIWIVLNILVMLLTIPNLKDIDWREL